MSDCAAPPCGRGPGLGAQTLSVRGTRPAPATTRTGAFRAPRSAGAAGTPPPPRLSRGGGGRGRGEEGGSAPARGGVPHSPPSLPPPTGCPDPKPGGKPQVDGSWGGAGLAQPGSPGALVVFPAD